jgi:hypothetical protein
MLSLNQINGYQPDQSQQQDYKRCLFYLHKTSNNMNQIARRLNADNAKGIISDALYKKLLNALIGIRNTLQDMTE